MSTLSSVIIRGLSTSLPAAGIPGRTYYTTDTFQVFYDDGGDVGDQVSPSCGNQNASRARAGRSGAPCMSF